MTGLCSARHPLTGLLAHLPDQVIVDGERADVKQPASAFVKQADRAVSVRLVRPGDPVAVSSNPV